jgi:hypothetical protein
MHKPPNLDGVFTPIRGRAVKKFCENFLIKQWEKADMSPVAVTREINEAYLLYLAPQVFEAMLPHFACSGTRSLGLSQITIVIKFPSLPTALFLHESSPPQTTLLQHSPPTNAGENIGRSVSQSVSISETLCFV